MATADQLRDEEQRLRREDTYDLIYATRFSRLMDEFCCSEPVRSVGPATVVQFGGSRPS